MRNATSKITYRRFGAAFAALAAGFVGLSGGAQAGTPEDAAPSITVSYQDLNLTSEAGSMALYSRIVSAARAVCGADELDIRDLRAVTREQSCETRAISHAVHQVNAPTLAAIYSARLGRG